MPRRAQGEPRPRRVVSHPYHDPATGRVRMASGGHELQTEKPLRRLRSYGPGLGSILPREGGQGDFRAVPLARSDGQRVYHTSAFYGRDEPDPGGGTYMLRYRTRRNNLPVLGPYVYGASRNTRSFRNLDLEWIERTDRESDGRSKKRSRLGDEEREEILAVAAMHPKMNQYDIAAITGRSVPTIARILREHKAAEAERAAERERLAALGGGRKMRPADLARIRGTG